MDDLLKFSYISYCRFNYPFYDYSVDWESSAIKYNYNAVSKVVGYYTKHYVDHYYIVKEINKYMVSDIKKNNTHIG